MHNLTDKYVTSPLDDNVYCRKNGQFLKHLRLFGFVDYQSFFDDRYPDQIKYCSCGLKCSFHNSKMEYLRSCGNRDCVGKVTSEVKKEFTQEQKDHQLQAFRNTMTEDKKQQLKNERTKTFNTKYGVDHPWQLSSVRDKIKQTMIDRYNAENFSTTLISEDAKQKLENKQWLVEQHVVQQKPLVVIAEELGVSSRLMSVYCDKHDIVVQQFQTSYWEQELKQFLDDNQIGYVHNDRITIAPKELDFYIPDYNLAIELCGLYWHCEAHERNTKNVHYDKYVKCRELGIQLLTIFEDEWEKKEIIFSKILHLCGKNKEVVAARKTVVITNIPVIAKDKFLNDYHIQGTGKGSVTIGLSHENILVALAVFKQEGDNYLLNRFATSVTVIGALGKILKVFKSMFPGKSIITFADHRWSYGGIYEKNGFEVVGEIPPDYAYIKNGKRVHKFNYRHASLPKRLKQYDPNLSERDNCFNNGVFRVWDCGKTKYVKQD